MTTTTTAPAAPPADLAEQTLTEELAAIAADKPGWRLHPSEQGTIWIDSASGWPTLRAPTPLAARRVIAGWEHLMDARNGAAA